MNAELELDLTKLPKPESIQMSSSRGQLNLTVYLGSVRSARLWAQALGVTLVDEDADCRYITVRQESGGATVEGVRVYLVGTEAVPTAQWPKRRAIAAEAERRKPAAAAADDPEPDPDMVAADAVWHREHPGEPCPNWQTCGECSVPALVNGVDYTAAEPGSVA